MLIGSEQTREEKRARKFAHKTKYSTDEQVSPGQVFFFFLEQPWSKYPAFGNCLSEAQLPL